jgi:Tol biopolymer transport system component/predicted Ser/Thr protein kinase
MSLSPRDRLGPYEILERIGAGGMGEVWKARDTRLNRIVAVKVSKDEFSERFEREARAVAALNHPHICQIYDVGADYLVMEFIEGQPLIGPLPLARAAEYARQILDALAAAHRKGIIHRDLKPGNILLSRQGIKSLDFGLARQTGALQPSDSTLTEALTGKGQIVGTLQYVAPEQLHGREADARSDLFAFGCVLYEMLTGKRAFDGASAASVIAAILEREPAPLDIAPSLERIVRKCLAKDPDERFQTALDLKTNLAWAIETAPTIHAPAPKRLRWVTAAVAIAAAFGGWAIAQYRGREPRGESGAVRFTIPPPENTRYSWGEVSPDGRRFAFIAVDTSSKSRLWVRELDSLNARPLAAADLSFFWSPDSRFIVFPHDGKLTKIGVSGGTPAQTICNTELVVGGSWSRDGTIVFGNGVGGGVEIFQVAATGGEAKPLTRLDKSRLEVQHMFPFFLPDGRHFLYTIQSGKRDYSGMYVGSLDAPDARIRLLDGGSNGVYAPAFPDGKASGYLLFARADVLMAQQFDAGNRRLKGEPFSVIDKIGSSLYPSFSASAQGVLAAIPRNTADQLTWFDRAGKRLGTIGVPGLHFQPQLSPDENTLAFDQVDDNANIWLQPIGRAAAASRFTFNFSVRPIWSADGRRIAFSTYGNGLSMKLFEGTEKEEVLVESGGFLDRRDPKTGYDLWALPIFGDRKPIPILRTEFNERCGVFSPDGKWLAYSSDESGRNEIYVQAFSASGAAGRKWQISYTGGMWPKWRRDGEEMFYLAGDSRIAALDVKTVPAFQPGTPQPLFATRVFAPEQRFEVTGDGRRFLVPDDASAGSAAPAIVVLNWTKGIKQ